MKTLLRFSLAALVVSLMTTATAPAQGRFATVDLRKVFDGYWKTKQADATLKERAADMDKEHKSMLADHTKAKEDYQKVLTAANDQAVSQEERDKRKKNAEGKLKDLKDLEETIGQFERQARTTLDEQRARMRNNILDQVRTAVTAKAKAAGYTFVLDSAADSVANTPVVLYTSNENDITDSVLQELNANAPPDAAKSAEKPAEKPAEKK